MSVTNYFVCVDNRHEFNVTRQVGDPLPKVCPECGDPVNQVWHKAPDMITHTCNTLGGQMIANTKKNGSNWGRDKHQEHIERNIRAKEVMREELETRLPPGAKLPERLKPGERPFWRPDHDKPLVGINKFSDNEKKDFIQTGKVPLGKSLEK